MHIIYACKNACVYVCMFTYTCRCIYICILFLYSLFYSSIYCQYKYRLSYLVYSFLISNLFSFAEALCSMVLLVPIGILE